MNTNSRHRNARTGAQAKARAILEFALTDEWQPSRPIVSRITETLGCHVKAVHRAAQALGVEHRYVAAGVTEWRLPRVDSTHASSPEVDHAGHAS